MYIPNRQPAHANIAVVTKYNGCQSCQRLFCDVINSYASSSWTYIELRVLVGHTPQSQPAGASVITWSDATRGFGTKRVRSSITENAGAKKHDG
jgi:hypothetical protein